MILQFLDADVMRTLEKKAELLSSSAEAIPGSALQGRFINTDLTCPSAFFGGRITRELALARDLSLRSEGSGERHLKYLYASFEKV